MPLNAKPPLWLALSFAATLSAPMARAGEPTKCASSYESAQLLRQRGKLVDARDAARACTQEGCPEIARKDCAGWIEQLEREIPSVAVVARDERDQEVPGARFFIDGNARTEAGAGRPIDLDPGTHTLRVEAAGYDSVEQSSTIVQGERGRILRITLRRRAAATRPSAPSAPSPPSPGVVAPREAHEASPALGPAIALGVFSLAALGTSAYFGVTGRSDLSHLRTSCAPACADDEVDPVRRKLIVSDVALGVGAIGSVIATYLFVRAFTHTQVQAAPLPSGGALFVRQIF